MKKKIEEILSEIFSNKYQREIKVVFKDQEREKEAQREWIFWK